MMHKKIYLMRHAQALSREENPDRPLSTIGQHHAKKMAAWMHAVGIPINHILHSDAHRAKETAEMVASQYNMTPTLFEALSPDAPLVALAETIGDLDNNTLLVGHLPNLDLLSNLLVTYDEQCSTFSFHPAAVAAFDLGENHCLLEWAIHPALISEKAILL